MNAQVFANPVVIPAGRAVRLGTGPGELTVVSGRLWLTQGAADERVEAGQTVRVRRGAVLEPWDAGAGVAYRWRPLPRDGLAFVRLGLAAGLRALARSAASMASRIQGCMPAGDSIASSGALK